MQQVKGFPLGCLGDKILLKIAFVLMSIHTVLGAAVIYQAVLLELPISTVTPEKLLSGLYDACEPVLGVKQGH